MTYPDPPIAERSDDDTDARLISKTQQYVDARLQQLLPDASSVRAWDKFYAIYDSLIRQFAGVYHLAGPDVSDCVQEVWKHVLSALPCFQYDPSRGGFRCWLYMIVRNKAMDVVRKKCRHATSSLSPIHETVLRARSADPGSLSDRQWKHELVRSLLAELRRRVSERNYQVLALRWLENRTPAEIATTLGLTAEQVRYRHHRVKQKFRQLFEARVKNALCLTD